MMRSEDSEIFFRSNESHTKLRLLEHRKDYIFQLYHRYGGLDIDESCLEWSFREVSCSRKLKDAPGCFNLANSYWNH